MLLIANVHNEGDKNSHYGSITKRDDYDEDYDKLVEQYAWTQCGSQTSHRVLNPLQA